MVIPYQSLTVLETTVGHITGYHLKNLWLVQTLPNSQNASRNFVFSCLNQLAYLMLPGGIIEENYSLLSTQGKSQLSNSMTFAAGLMDVNTLLLLLHKENINTLSHIWKRNLSNISSATLWKPILECQRSLKMLVLILAPWSHCF